MIFDSPIVQSKKTSQWVLMECRIVGVQSSLKCDLMGFGELKMLNFRWLEVHFISKNQHEKFNQRNRIKILPKSICDC